MKLILALMLLATSLTARDLAWDYPYDRSHVVFEVWRTQSIQVLNWTLVAVTPDLIYSFDPDLAPAGFFRVRARDTETGLVSEWATTGN